VSERVNDLAFPISKHNDHYCHSRDVIFQALEIGYAHSVSYVAHVSTM